MYLASENTFLEFYQAQILLTSGALFIDCLILINFRINMLTFPWQIVETLGVLSFVSKLETPITLVVEYSNYPRIVAGGILNELVSTVLARLVPKQYSNANPGSYEG